MPDISVPTSAGSPRPEGSRPLRLPSRLPFQPVPAYKLSPFERFAGGVVALGLLSVLTTAAVLTPSTEGYGTHTALGMPACGWVVAFGKPCPTCGMTTAFAHTANLDFVAAAQTQPFGTALAIASATIFWVCAHMAVFGSTLWGELGVLLRPKVVALAVVFLLAAWAYTWVTW